jgi:hypothetical protein
MNEYRPNRPGSVVPIHAGFSYSRRSNDRPILAVSPLWRGRSSSNNTAHVMWHK